MVVGRIADGITRSVESVGDTVSGALFEPVIRLGVTGLARSGKTVFITSLVANLMNRSRMPGLLATREGSIQAAYLQPQPDDTVPRFAYEAHLARLSGPTPSWPDSTRAISELRLSFRVQSRGILGAMSGPRTVHLDIVDYPGEWLLDLGLMNRSYTDWSAETLAEALRRQDAAEFLAKLAATDTDARLDEPTAQALAESYTAYLRASRAAGYSDCTPGRFLMPGDLEGSPALTFVPLPAGERRAPRGSLHREMERRFEAYKARVVTPFFRDHFARIDRQIVLVDLLGAIHSGPHGVADLGDALDKILRAFRPGRNAWLARLLLGRRVERILFAATKADHIHHSQHARLTAIMQAMLRSAKDRADFSGAQTEALALAALRATVEETREHDGRSLDMVRGRLLEDGRNAAFYPGDLPADPAAILTPARTAEPGWLDADYGIMRFAPAPVSLKPGEGPPHIRLDRVAEFLIGDKLR